MTTTVAEALTIRTSTDADLASIGSLFTPAKSPELLRWLLSDPEDARTLRSWVAMEGADLMGHIGYTVSTFTDGRQALRGVYPVVWKVRTEARGAVGMRLLTRVLDKGDFSFIIGGSAQARNLYRVFGYKNIFEVPTYRKTRNLRGWGVRLFSRAGARALKMRARSVRGEIFGGSAAGAGTASDVVAPVMENRLSVTALERAASCPEVDGRLLTLHVDGDDVPVVVYVRQQGSGPIVGTIVHVPHLGPDPARWREVVRLTEAALAARGCSHINVLASEPVFQRALVDCGFALDKKLPFWFRGRGAAPPAWHLTLVEGDLGYRK